MKQSWYAGDATRATSIVLSAFGLAVAIGYSPTIVTNPYYFGWVDHPEHRWVFMARVWRFAFQVVRRRDRLTRFKLTWIGRELINTRRKP